MQTSTLIYQQSKAKKYFINVLFKDITLSRRLLNTSANASNNIVYYAIDT